MKLRANLAAVAALGLCASAPAANAQSLTTTFADGNRFDGNMFNVQSTSDLTINSFAVNVDSGSVPIDVYYKLGTYVGHTTTSADWTLLGQATVTGQGQDNPTPVPIGGLTLPANTLYGLYVTVDTNVNAAPYMYYSNGANTYSNADLSITTGVGEGGLFGSLSVTSPRSWNGTINYTLAPAATPEPGSIALLVGMTTVGAGVLRRRRK